MILQWHKTLLKVPTNPTKIKWVECAKLCFQKNACMQKRAYSNFMYIFQCLPWFLLHILHISCYKSGAWTPDWAFSNKYEQMFEGYWKFGLCYRAVVTTCFLFATVLLLAYTVFQIIVINIDVILLSHWDQEMTYLLLFLKH